MDSIEHGTLLDEEGAALMEKQGTWLVPTLSVIQRYATIGSASGLDQVSQQKSQMILKYQSVAFHLAINHHLRIAFGLDDDPDFLPKEFPAMVKGGLTPIEALQAATIHAAELLRLSEAVASIEAGKFADIQGGSSMHIASIGIDLGKGYFSPGCIGERNQILLRKKFSRSQLVAYTASLIGLEACAGSHFLGTVLRQQN